MTVLRILACGRMPRLDFAHDGQQIRINLGIAHPDNPMAIETIEAIIDTGATKTAIPARIVQSLRLPLGSRRFVRAVGGDGLRNFHFCSLALYPYPETGSPYMLDQMFEVLAMSDNDAPLALIGMDVLGNRGMLMRANRTGYLDI
jgi:hypothetical protein